MVEWVAAFAEEAHAEHVDAPGFVDARLQGSGGIVVWEHDGVVSLAGYGGRTPNGIRIGPVYTPPEKRRNGYASALVAELSRRLLDEGRSHCFLYTDLANPTANRIYMDVGYELVAESAEIAFEPA
jgi:predicted GNAT family acetyltransferase